MKKPFLFLLAALLLAMAWIAPKEALALSAGNGAAVQNEGEDPTPERPPVPQEPDYDPLPDNAIALTERVIGDWYADYAGLVITLTIQQNGRYALSAPGADTLTGAWETKDSLLVLDGNKKEALESVNGTLRWNGASLLFTREQPWAYVPGKVLEEDREGAFDGFWKSQYVGVRGGTVLSNVVGEDTFIYIEGTHVALGGTQFGNVIKTFTGENGALTLREDGKTITLELLQDGFLRLSISGKQPVTIYLMPAAIPDV